MALEHQLEGIYEHVMTARMEYKTDHEDGCVIEVAAPLRFRSARKVYRQLRKWQNWERHQKGCGQRAALIAATAERIAAAIDNPDEERWDER